MTPSKRAAGQGRAPAGPGCERRSAAPMADAAPPGSASSPVGAEPGTYSSPPSPNPTRVTAEMPTPATGAAESCPVPAAPGRGRAARSPAAGVGASPAPSAGLQAIAAAMSEDRGPDSLEAHLRKLMKGFSLTGFHVEKSLDVEKNRKNVSVKGWPDWTIRGPRGVLFRELKAQRGRVAPEQQEWLDALAASGADVGVWRPECLLSGRIAAELAALAGLRGAA